MKPQKRVRTVEIVVLIRFGFFSIFPHIIKSSRILYKILSEYKRDIKMSSIYMHSFSAVFLEYSLLDFIFKFPNFSEFLSFSVLLNITAQ